MRAPQAKQLKATSVTPSTRQPAPRQPTAGGNQGLLDQHQSSARQVALQSLANASPRTLQLARLQSIADASTRYPAQQQQATPRNQGAAGQATPVAINADSTLEREADIMGAKALRQGVSGIPDERRSTKLFVGTPLVQRMAEFAGTDDSSISALKKLLVGSKDELAKALNVQEETETEDDKSFPRKKFDQIFNDSAGTALFAALYRVKYSARNYGWFDMSNIQSKLLLFYEALGALGTMAENPRRIINPEIAESRAERAEVDRSWQAFKNAFKKPYRVHKLAILGAGAASAYYLTANKSSIDPYNSIIIGTVQPWAGQRGPGDVNHPAHMISTRRDQAMPPSTGSMGTGPEALMGRGNFSADIEQTLSGSGLRRKDSKVENVAKIALSALLGDAVPQGFGTHVYQITLEGGAKHFALDVVAGLGAGPHKELENKKELNDEFETVDQGEKFAGIPRVMNLDEFQSKADDIYAALGESSATILVSGGNAAIDAVTRIIRKNNASGTARLEVIWAHGRSEPPFLPGTDNEMTEGGAGEHLSRDAPGYLADEDKRTTKTAFSPGAAKFVGGTGAVTKSGSRLKVAVTTVSNKSYDRGVSGHSYDTDFYVHAQGQDARELDRRFRSESDPKSLMNRATPVLDRDHEMGTGLLPTIVGARVGSESKDDRSSLTFIGATAEAAGGLFDDKAYLKADSLPSHIKDLAALTAGLPDVNPRLSKPDLEGFGSIQDHASAIRWATTVDAARQLEALGAEPTADEDRVKRYPRANPQVSRRDIYLKIAGTLRAIAKVAQLPVPDLNEVSGGTAPPKKLAEKKFDELIDTLPLNVLAHAQLGASRAMIETAAGFRPAYVAEDANFAVDNRTTIATYIAVNYASLSMEAANYWTNRIVEARRPSPAEAASEKRKGLDPSGEPGLMGPVPNPFDRNRETAASFTAAFKTLLHEANEEAKLDSD